MRKYYFMVSSVYHWSAIKVGDKKLNDTFSDEPHLIGFAPVFDDEEAARRFAPDKKIMIVKSEEATPNA